MNSPKKTARIAGFLYLIAFILIPFAEFFVRQRLVVPGDAAITASNIMASESLFRLGFVSDLIAQIVYIFLVLVLYNLLKPVNKNHALLMVILWMVGVPITMLNLLNHFASLLLLSGADYLTAFTADQLHAQVMFFLDLHQHGVLIVDIFWGLWLFPFGYLVFKSGYFPRFLGVLLMIACFGYLIEFFGNFLLPKYEEIYGWIAWASVPAELLMPLWLLIRGVNVEQWEKRAIESAKTDLN